MIEQSALNKVLAEATMPLPAEEVFRLIPQDGVFHKIFPADEPHNAMWDFAVLDDGRVFMSLCGEICHAVYVRLYEFLPESKEFKLHFKLEDLVFQFDRAIRASKIHSSICKMKDGRLIMTTHTTAKSPYHPGWMPEAYYSHLWEGYQGSVVLIYDPDTGVLENRGIPIPHESIYGGVYDAAHDAFFFTGYLRGHLYRLDLRTNGIRDFGQVTEYGSFRLHIGPDGNVYGNSRSGNLYQVDTETLEIKDVATIPSSWGKMSEGERQIHFVVNAPDGCMYMALYYSPNLLRFDPRTEELKEIGCYRPDDYPVPFYLDSPGGMTMDDKGVLWYSLSTSFRPRGASSYLIKWDLLHGERPKYFGVLGSRQRTVHVVSEMFWRNGILYLSDTNHHFDPPGVMTIDLEKMEESFEKHGFGPLSVDVWDYIAYADGAKQYPGDDFVRQVEKYLEQDQITVDQTKVIQTNPTDFITDKVAFIRVWREIGTEISPVKALSWKDQNTLLAYCQGKNATTKLIIRNDKLAAAETVDGLPKAEEIPKELAALDYPAIPGRQYLAVANAFCKFENGYLVGTKDGMLAFVKEGKVCSLGVVTAGGAIRALTADQKHGVAYGIAGDPMDMGMVFRYDAENGMRLLGRVFANSYEIPAIYGSYELSCCALSADGSKLAIGTQDRMGMLYIFHLTADAEWRVER